MHCVGLHPRFRRAASPAVNASSGMLQQFAMLSCVINRCNRAYLHPLLPARAQGCAWQCHSGQTLPHASSLFQALAHITPTTPLLQHPPPASSIVYQPTQRRQCMVHDSKHICTNPGVASGYKVLSFGQVSADQMKSQKTGANKLTCGL